MRGSFQGNVIGNATRAVETRNFGNGVVGSTYLAVNNGKRDDASTFFVHVTFWGKNAELAAQYVQKGTPVYCFGSVSEETYAAKDGTQRTNIAMNVSGFNVLSYGSKSDGSWSSNGSYRQNQPQQYTPQQVDDVRNFGSEGVGNGDGIPF